MNVLDIPVPRSVQQKLCVLRTLCGHCVHHAQDMMRCERGDATDSLCTVSAATTAMLWFLPFQLTNPVRNPYVLRSRAMSSHA